jgi:hypothetical protein
VTAKMGEKNGSRILWADLSDDTSDTRAVGFSTPVASQMPVGCPALTLAPGS